MPARARNVPARSGRNSVGSTSSKITSRCGWSNWTATASEVATMRRAKRVVRYRSTRRARADCTTISLACQTCGRRTRAAAAHPYQEWRVLV
jgi:hypothetical protein